MWRTFRDLGGFIWVILKLGRTDLESEQSRENWERNILTSIVILLVLTYISIASE
ncbi:hypothetical protein SAMN04488034_1231 [Salinimicrobium catena]|uniref:Uncharacterized protein n=1 Tax=Salinimicrobium catena TaxID=390640 RepID=A0A1H5PIC2_9FLAO|nr:hypothetical protein SAMN04488140_1052 [Salinimicrobium catena]SDL84684.1 hypothetical protein SAMN04488140_11720 [Salinimicrobium catena]SDL86846.1 hypothetical protein SAMN04488140_12013 [Salinimicrobium catena]SDL88106.1 hypothetical protein SAMN04488140_1241 [Salinimicrobium catena]SEF04669.1 hypothetical protein SAMN04488034_105159 [Salinimicrobium catena]